MAPNNGRALARRLAAHTEARLVDSWSEGPDVALLRPNSEVDSVALHSIREPAEVAIARLPPQQGAAACVSALGYVELPEGNGQDRRRARLTVAVTCCSATSILRFADGTVIGSDEAEGLLVDVLRSWAGLARCSCSPVGT